MRAELVCNERGQVIGVLKVVYLRELVRLINKGQLQVPCSECGAMNSFSELDSVDLFICTARGKPVTPA